MDNYYKVPIEHELNLTKFLSDSIANHFVPVDPRSRERQLPSQCFECCLRHYIVILAYGRLLERKNRTHWY